MERDQAVAYGRRFWAWSTRSIRRAVIVFGALIFVCFCCPATGVIAVLSPATSTPTVTVTVTARPTRTLMDTATMRPTETSRPTETMKPSSTWTVTPVPATSTATRVVPSATATLVPSETPLPATSTVAPPTWTPAPTNTQAPVGPQVRIASVNKQAEYVDLVNRGDAPQDLTNWILVSEKGNQRCSLAGVIAPGATLRVHAMTGPGDAGNYSCGFGNNIWNNSESDPAVLLDAAGNEVDRR